MRTGFMSLLLLVTSLVVSSQEVSIIPRPVSLQTKPGRFVISEKTVIAAPDDQDRKTAGLFNEYLQQVYGFRLDIDKQESKNYIRLTTKKFIKAPGRDGYDLEVTKDGISISGDTYAGTFYGMQTLIQLLPVANKSRLPDPRLDIPFVAVHDYPRFAYRGLHLDVGRHFFPVSRRKTHHQTRPRFPALIF